MWKNKKNMEVFIQRMINETKKRAFLCECGVFFEGNTVDLSKFITCKKCQKAYEIFTPTVRTGH